MLCCFLTVWPFAPFAPFIFSMLNVAVVVLVNSKVRHTTLRVESRATLDSVGVHHL